MARYTLAVDRRYGKDRERDFFLEAIPKEVCGLHQMKGYLFWHKCLTHKKKNMKREITGGS